MPISDYGSLRTVEAERRRSPDTDNLCNSTDNLGCSGAVRLLCGLFTLGFALFEDLRRGEPAFTRTDARRDCGIDDSSRGEIIYRKAIS
jgi:hypothetical protein